MLNEDQRKQVKELIEDHAEKGKLTCGQKYQILLILSAILGTLFTILTAGFYIAVKNEAFKATNEFVQGELSNFKVPSGMVAAFKLEDKCPAGWTVYAAAQGRVIAGVLPEGMQVLDGSSSMSFQDLGGMLNHQLIPSELPSHNHEVFKPIVEQMLSPGDGVILQEYTDFTLMSGENVPHSNLQPYVALYFCEKD